MWETAQTLGLTHWFPKKTKAKKVCCGVCPPYKKNPPKNTDLQKAWLFISPASYYRINPRACTFKIPSYSVWMQRHDRRAGLYVWLASGVPWNYRTAPACLQAHFLLFVFQCQKFPSELKKTSKRGSGKTPTGKISLSTASNSACGLGHAISTGRSVDQQGPCIVGIQCSIASICWYCCTR